MSLRGSKGSLMNLPVGDLRIIMVMCPSPSKSSIRSSPFLPSPSLSSTSIPERGELAVLGSLKKLFRASGLMVGVM